MKYSEVRPILNTGDIVLFSGNGFISNAIKMLDQSKWSHVGMVLKLEQYNTVLLWESTTLSDLKDIEKNTYIKGVQTVPLSQRVATYDGEIAIRRLAIDHRINRNTINKSVIKFRAEMDGLPYEQNRLELIKSLYDGPFGLNKEDLSSVFCSELVAECYQRIGILSDLIPSNEYVPSQFSTEHNLKLDYACLSKEIMIEI